MYEENEERMKLDHQVAVDKCIENHRKEVKELKEKMKEMTLEKYEKEKKCKVITLEGDDEENQQYIKQTEGQDGGLKIENASRSELEIEKGGEKELEKEREDLEVRVEKVKEKEMEAEMKKLEEKVKQKTKGNEKKKEPKKGSKDQEEKVEKVKEKEREDEEKREKQEKEGSYKKVIEGVSIHIEDRKSLDVGEYLNGTIITLYMEWYKRNLKDTLADKKNLVGNTTNSANATVGQ